MGPIFVSYLRHDKDRVDRLVQGLNALGADIWRDQNKLAGGDHWADEISTAISKCEYFIPCFSSAFHLDGMSTMEKEVGIAASLWDRRATSDRKWILPIKLGDCAIPAVPLNKSLSLPELHWIRLEDEGWDDSLRAIADIVLQRARERAWQALCEAAETLQSAERARAESMAFAIKCEFNEASKTELARSETLRMERRNDFSKALSAHFSKYKDDYNPLIEMDMSFEHIVVEARKEHESLRFGCMIAGLVFILICGLVAFLAYWIACGIRKFC